MRLKNVKNAKNIIEEGKYYVNKPCDYKGKWHELFQNDNPIYLEIGMGKGKFILENALQNTDVNYIGIEKYDSVLVRAIQKTNKFELNNLKLIKNKKNAIPKGATPSTIVNRLKKNPSNIKITVFIFIYLFNLILFKFIVLFFTAVPSLSIKNLLLCLT